MAANEILLRRKKKVRQYHLVSYNCEMFSYDLAVLLSSQKSRLRFLRKTTSNTNSQTDVDMINRSLGDEVPGRFYYKVRTWELLQRLVLLAHCVFVVALIFFFRYTGFSGAPTTQSVESLVKHEGGIIGVTIVRNVTLPWFYM